MAVTTVVRARRTPSSALSLATSRLAAARAGLRTEVGRRRLAERTFATGERRHAVHLERELLMEERLRHLTRRLLIVQEEERARISRDLHDAIGQTLAGINVGLATLKNAVISDSKDLSEQISLAQRLVEHSMKGVHEFARELRPTLLDDLGLGAALRSHSTAFAEENSLRLRFTASPESNRLDPVRSTALFRVAQEALTNVARHARAGAVTIDLRVIRASVRMEVRDDGRSFDVNRMGRSRRNRHLGLLGMQERMDMVGGAFSISSSPRGGTIVRAEVPFGRETLA